jgi:hypothetical protein
MVAILEKERSSSLCLVSKKHKQEPIGSKYGVPILAAKGTVLDILGLEPGAD